MSKVLRLTDSLYNVPVLATAETLNTVLKYLSDRNNGADLSLANVKTSSGLPIEYNAATKTGVLRIEGPLTYRPTILSAVCGLQSYQNIEADLDRKSVV